MTRDRCIGWMAAFGTMAALMIVQVAEAQQGGGSSGPEGPIGTGGIGGPRVRMSSGAGVGAGTSVRLASIKEVQKALKLTAKQKKEVKQIDDDLRNGFRNLLQTGMAREGMQRVNEDAAAKLKEVLDDEQEKRLLGITIQMVGANAVNVDAKLAKELKITDDQKRKLEEVQQGNMREMSEVFSSGNPNEERRGTFDEMRKNGEKKLLDVLTSEQQAQLNTLKGEELKIDMMNLPGGGSGDRRRGGGFFRGGDQGRSGRENSAGGGSE